MALQNIGAANSDDAFYRYKMPKMITKIEGRGNGIKTKIVNMVDIAKALARPASYTTKYFGCELGAQSKFDEKTGLSHVNGAHDTVKLAGLLENFIKKYVQCYGCGNPETEINITKSQMITMKCAACGYLSDVDMRDKLTTFILKNPPEQKKGGKDKKAMRRAEKERLKEGEAADEEQKKTKKVVKKKSTTAVSSKSKKKASGGGGSDEDHHSSSGGGGSQGDENEAPDEDDEDDNVQWQTDTSLEAAKQRIEEQLSAVTAEMVILSTAEPERPKSTNKSLSNSNTEESLAEKIKTYLKTPGGASPGQLPTFLASLSGSSPQEAMDALFMALFEGVEKGIAKEVGKKKAYLSAVVTGDDGSQQMFLLRAIERFSVKSKGDAMKEVALVLKVLYDADVLEEEQIVKWYEEGVASGGHGKGSAQVWKNVKPFIEWLQNAESESEEE
ncbi:Eukaryotic translation initiation factor 5 [Acorus calamus]|uniref:Eukaryotic translation initiation factor 5 n=1 Tax=Acorus calamus TaxID=4465 RepID=A0AAV9DP94_ACOCL|nr:Eukaryotic translation initiation factor 5 [Acorus calamus]